jgi:hypothetical protein
MLLIDERYFLALLTEEKTKKNIGLRGALF